MVVKNSLQWIAHHKLWSGISLCLLLIAIFFIPDSISEEELTANQWCSSYPYPLLRWTFSNNGRFKQSSRIIDGGGGASDFADYGTWSLSQKSVFVDIDQTDLLSGEPFLIRKSKVSNLLWTYSDLLGNAYTEEHEKVYFWHQCPEF